jgi:hypothetical protein
VSEPLAEPFDAILELAGEPLRDAMASVERRLHEIAGIELHALYTIEAGGQAPAPAARLRRRTRQRRSHGALPRGGGGRADPFRDARSRRCSRRRAAAPRSRDDLRRRRARGRDVHRDLLFSSAFAELARNESIAQLASLSAASSALARGELMQRADAWRSDVTLERYLERCELKTARLFAAACELGALAGDGPPLGPFGRAVGLAFQILDDVLDITGPAERTGKRPGADLLDGTVTLPLILARERSPELAALDLREISGPDEAHRICKAIEATGAAEQARQQALELVASSKRSLPDGPPQQRRALELLADGLVERFS